MKKLFCCPALELFHCLPLWKTVLFVSSRAFSLSTPTFSLSTPVDNSEAAWKKATKCNKQYFKFLPAFQCSIVCQFNGSMGFLDYLFFEFYQTFKSFLN